MTSSLAAVNWDTYWLYVLAEVALSLSPGPAVMLVVACGLTYGARRSLHATLGILSANAIYFAISATALGAVLVASSTFFLAVKWLGAAYLVYIGVAALFGRASPITVARDERSGGFRARSTCPRTDACSSPIRRRSCSSRRSCRSSSTRGCRGSADGMARRRVHDS